MHQVNEIMQRIAIIYEPIAAKNHFSDVNSLGVTKPVSMRQTNSGRLLFHLD